MMPRFLSLSVFSLASALAVQAGTASSIDRLGVPIASSHWDAALPESDHPAFASDLGALQEGRLSLGFMQSDLGHLSLSVPGFQVISANTRWDPLKDDTVSKPYRFAPDQAKYFLDATGHEATRYRGYFNVAGGVSASNFMRGPRSWDIGLGLFMESQQIYNEDESVRLWSNHELGGSVSAKLGELSLAGSWSNSEYRYRLGYVHPLDWQFGMLVYQNPALSKGFGFQPEFEKVFHQSIRIRAGLHSQYVYPALLERQIMLGMSLRFRPWRTDVDPTWLKLLVAPGADSGSGWGKYLYDWELSVDVAVDQLYPASNAVVTISRWF